MCRPESWFNLNFMSSANYSFDGRVQEQFPLEFLTDLISTPMPRSGSSCLRLRRWSVSHLTSAQNLSVLSSGFGLVQFKSFPLSYPKLAKLAGNVRRDKKSLFNFLYPSYLNLTDTFFFHSDGRLTSLREQSSRNTNVRNKYEVEALLVGAMQASRMQIVNSGNFFLKAPSEQRNLLFIQPEELQYPSPDSLDDFLQAMNFLNKIYYFPMRSTAHVS